MTYPPPVSPDPFGQQPDPYAQPPQPDPYAAQPPPQPDPYAAQPPQPDPYAQPNPYAQPPQAYGSPVVPGSPAAPQYGQQAQYGQPPYAQQPYAQQPYGYPAQPQAPQNSMALVAMILSLVGLLTWITAPIGAILGHIALKQIRETGEQGEGMAKAGIIVGWIITGLGVLSCVCFVAVPIIGAISTTP